VGKFIHPTHKMPYKQNLGHYNQLKFFINYEYFQQGLLYIFMGAITQYKDKSRRLYFMTDYTIANEYVLPSEGKIYGDTMINPHVKLRSMTTAEEMRRLNHTDKPYKAMSEIIDDCLVDDLGISAYDLCLADYQYLLHKLRIVTYGPIYKINSTCPYCGSTNTHHINLDEMTLVPLNLEEFKKYSEFILPLTKKEIKLRVQTPRILDGVTYKTKEYNRKHPEASDSAFLFTLESLIATVDGEKIEQFRMAEYLKSLPMMDTNYILKAAQKLNSMFGLDGNLDNTCNVCGLDYTSSFRTTSEFFGPSID
jgi:hypothetical protein